MRMANIVLGATLLRKDAPPCSNTWTVISMVSKYALGVFTHRTRMVRSGNIWRNTGLDLTDHVTVQMSFKKSKYKV
jgi:hypothetical protein